MAYKEVSLTLEYLSVSIWVAVMAKARSACERDGWMGKLRKLRRRDNIMERTQT